MLKTKKLTAFVLAAALLLAAFSSAALPTAFAADEENISYHVTDHTLYISGEGDMGTHVYFLWPWYLQRKSIQRVVIGEGITSVGMDAFYGYKNLQSVSLPDTLKSVGASSFYGCSALESITIPDGVTEIGGSAFYYCTGLARINIPNGVETISKSAFSGCGSLTEIVLPESVNSIYPNAFSDCERLERITFPQTLNYVGNDAFTNTAWFDAQPDGVVYIRSVAYQYKGEMPEGATVSIKDGTTVISPNAFAGRTQLAGVCLPASVTAIAENAFAGCDSLTDVYYAGNSIQWGKINIIAGNAALENARIHYNTTQPQPRCAYCGQDHSGTTFGPVIRLLHSILYFFAQMFGKA